MGNRGELRPKHYNSFQPCKPSKPWIACVLQDENGVPYPKDDELNYTKLFILDEVTAFAAGHRPCYGCQGKRYNLFVEVWQKANRIKRSYLDDHLHAERCDADEGGGKRTELCNLSGLPSGVMVQLATNEQPYLYLWGKLFPWTVTGYAAPITIDTTTEVLTLTPVSIIKTFQAGFPLLVNSTKTIHPSVFGHL